MIFRAVHPPIAPEAASLARQFPAMTACRLLVEPMPSGQSEAHVEILLPHHQLLNEVGADAEAARAKALATASARSAEIAKRDPRILKR